MDYKEVKESYSAIAPALKELEEAGSVLVIRNKDATPRLLFHNDAQQNINISSEFRRMWREIEIPKTDTDLQKELKNGKKKTREGGR